MVNHHHFRLILGHAALISRSASEIHVHIAEFGLGEIAAGLPFGPTLAGRLQIHIGFASVHGALSALIENIHPPVAPEAPG